MMTVQKSPDLDHKMLPKLVSKQDIAERLSVSIYAVDGWRETDPNFPDPVTPPGTTGGRGRMVRWREEDIDLWGATWLNRPAVPAKAGRPALSPAELLGR